MSVHPMHYKAINLNVHKITLDNRDDELTNHINIHTIGAVGENDIHLKSTNLKINDGALQANEIQSLDGTVMIDFNGSNTAIDFNGRTIQNMTLNLTPSSVATSAIASTNYPSNDLEYELDQIHTNINSKLSQTGFTANKVLTTTGGGVLTASINTVDLVLKTANTTFTGNHTFQKDVTIDENNTGKLKFVLNNGSLPPQACTTQLLSAPHQNTNDTAFTLSLPSIKTGETADQLVGKDAVQTLTGKTISGSDNTITNVPYANLTGTPTIPDVSTFITNSSGQYTYSNLGGIPTDIITESNAKTLTGKTIDAGSNTITNIPYANLTGTPTIPDVSTFITASSSDILTNKQHRGLDIIPDGDSSSTTKTTISFTQDKSNGQPNYRYDVEVGIFQFIQERSSGDDLIYYIDNTNGDFHIFSSGLFQFKNATGNFGIGLLRTGSWSPSVLPQERLHIFRQESGNTFDRIMLLEKSTTSDFSEDGNGSGCYIEFINRNQGANYYGSARVGSIYDGGDDDGSSALVFWTSNGTGSSYGSGDTAGYDSNNSQAERMRITRLGRVGIGDSNPDCGLEIDLTASVSVPTGQAYWYNGEQGHSAFSRSLAIHAHGAVWSDSTSGFISTSDRRIKKNIVDCSDALSTLNQLQVKNYEYIAGNGLLNEGLSQPPTVGFIAQEIETILPRAVQTETGFIPNLYRETTNFTVSEDLILTIHEQFNSNKVKIYIHYVNGEMQCLKYEVGGGNKNKINNNNIEYIWLFGEEVNDFKTLKKSVIFSMNVRATQQLYEKQKVLEAKIETVQESQKSLQALVNSLNFRISSLEKELLN